MIKLPNFGLFLSAPSHRPSPTKSTPAMRSPCCSDSTTQQLTAYVISVRMVIPVHQMGAIPLLSLARWSMLLSLRRVLSVLSISRVFQSRKQADLHAARPPCCMAPSLPHFARLAQPHGSRSGDNPQTQKPNNSANIMPGGADCQHAKNLRIYTHPVETLSEMSTTAARGRAFESAVV